MWPPPMIPPPSDSQIGRRRKRTGSKDTAKTSLSISSARGDSLQSEREWGKENPSSAQDATPDIDYMEPAIDGPPSSERLRQLSKQMKSASYLSRPHMQHNESSGSSPRRAMERSPWEQAFDSINLSRHPSNRSTSSSTPSGERRERESIQVLGRNLFQFNNKSKRASSSHSSSNSSMYSSETPGDAATSKDPIIPTIFSRRKPSRDETAQKRPPISGPFNFQHVTHTQRENLPDLRRGNRMDLASEFSAVRTPGPAATPGALKIDAQDLHHFANNSIDSADAEHQDEENIALTGPRSRHSFLPQPTAQSLGSRRLIKPARSQDQLRSSPPRHSLQPPRSQSPTETGNPAPTSSAPVPPPRVSSRQSLMADGFSAFASASLDRPRTSGGGFRQPQPYDPSEPVDQPQPPATSHGFVPPAEFEGFDVDERRFSHAITTPDDAAWPLACATPTPFDKALPDVPEEEEQYGISGRSRLSLTSNNSSLRGSQSVPALRSFSQSQRPTSGASDTLGPFDMVAAQRPLKAGNEQPPVTETAPSQDSWEDDIDYCYEHEAEANFDYQWERPSLDGHRESLSPSVHVDIVDDELAEANPTGTAGSSHAVAVNTQATAPALSPSSQTSTGPGPEAISPNSHLAVTSNFSLPRGEKGSRVSQLKGIRPVSYASSFRESHGFNLSPSLLIPGDYHQQMLAEKHDFHDDEILREAYQGPFHDELSPATDNKSYQQRSSTSTTETNSTSRTDTTGERHVSANSTFTTMTRLTMSSSSTSLSKSAGVITESAEPMPTTQFIDANDEAEDDQESTPPATKDTVPELTPFPVSNFAKKPYHRPHASESVVRDEIAPLKSQEAAKYRRPRARTSSLTAKVPPVGQYAIFPRSYVKGTGDQI